MRFSQDEVSDEKPLEKLTKPTKIAIVDDDPVVIDLLSTSFRKANFMCEGFSSAKEFISSNSYKAGRGIL